MVFFIKPSGFNNPNPHISTSNIGVESKTLEEIENDLLQNVKRKSSAAREAFLDQPLVFELLLTC